MRGRIYKLPAYRRYFIDRGTQKAWIFAQLHEGGRAVSWKIIEIPIKSVEGHSRSFHSFEKWKRPTWTMLYLPASSG